MKFTKTRIKIILEAIGRGLSQKDAAKLADVSEVTLSTWKKENLNFLNAIEKKEIGVKEKIIDTIIRKSEKEWTAGAWYLERKYPEEYSERRRIEIDAEPYLQIVWPEKPKEIIDGKVMPPKQLSPPKKPKLT